MVFGIYFVLRHQASSHNFLSVIFGIFGIFRIGICDRKKIRRKIFDRKHFRSKNEKYFSRPKHFRKKIYGKVNEKSHEFIIN